MLTKIKYFNCNLSPTEFILHSIVPYALKPFCGLLDFKRNAVSTYVLYIFPFVLICYHDFWSIRLQVNLISLFQKKKNTKQEIISRNISHNILSLSRVLEVHWKLFFTYESIQLIPLMKNPSLPHFPWFWLSIKNGKLLNNASRCFIFKDNITEDNLLYDLGAWIIYHISVANEQMRLHFVFTIQASKELN